MVFYADYYAAKPRLQAYIVDISKTSRWRACFNAEVLDSHKSLASLKWGQNCQDYKIVTKAETGNMGSQPALKVEVGWPKVPSKLKSYVSYWGEFIPGAAYLLGFADRYKNNKNHQAEVILALSSPRFVDVLVELPKVTMYYTALRIPIPIPIRSVTQNEILQAPTWNVFAEAPQTLMKSLQGECKMSEDKITTFNGIDLNQGLSEGCYHVLAQDCTDELKFSVMVKKSKKDPKRNDLNILLGSHDITLSSKSGSPEVTINGNAITKDELPFRSFSEPEVEILETEEGLALKAPEFGIDTILFDGQNIKMQPTLSMKGQLCGICGHNDEETVQEFRRPDGSVAKDETSHFHSWMLPSESCAEGCNLQQSLVTVEKELHGEKSKCYTVHPVLRCAKGCSPLKTAQVTAGFHCLPSDSSLDLAEGQTHLNKPEDLTEMVDAHTSCACENCSS